MAAVDDSLAGELETTAFSLGMDVLIETHDAAEFDRALRLKSPLLGINNRNLKTMTTDLVATEQLAEEVPDSVILVSESGLKNTDDAQRALEAGASAILIGETLMRHEDPTRAVEEYLALRVSED